MPAPEMVWWTQAVGAWGQIDGNGNAADVSRSFGGFSTGVDRRFDGNWRAGIAAGYNNSMVSDSARASSANIDTAQFGAYAGTNHGPWNFRAGAAASWSTIATNRSILFPGFSDAASAHYGAAVAQLFDEVGYSMTLGAVAAEPFGGLAWVYLRTDGFNETGNTMAALTGSSRQNDVGYSTLGTRAATSFMLPNATALTVHGSVAWQHAFGDVTPNALLAFQGSAAPFTVAGVPLARDAALVETGLDALIASQTTIGISYTGQLAEHLQDHSVKGNLRVRF
jgi:outer membrane autotransporter protein